MRHDDETMRAAAGGRFVVILRDKRRDGVGEFLGERGALRRRSEANLSINRQGREAFSRLVRTTNEISHLADDPRAQGDEIIRRQPVDFPMRIRGGSLQCVEVR